MLQACSGAVGTVLSRILAVPVCYGPSRAAGSSNYIEIGQSSNWLRTDRGASLNVGASTQETSRCHGSSGAGARGTCDRCDQRQWPELLYYSAKASASPMRRCSK